MKSEIETGASHSQDSPYPRQPTPTGSERSSQDSPVITLRGVVLGVLTIAAMFYFIVRVGQGMRVGSYVHSQFPMAVFMPFVLWLFLNVALKRVWPRVALNQGELLTIFSMMWVVGTIPQLGWINYWTSIVAAPTYFATLENRWAETFFDYLPWHVFADRSSRVIDKFWFGLAEGEALPWDGWMGVIGQWLGVSLGMVVFGFCLIVVFQRQWVESERLAFPLVQMPLDLTQGFDGPRSMPDIFRSRIFWLGFGVVFLPILYNVGTYFALGLPLLELYWKPYFVELGQDLPRIRFRVMPLVMGVTYLCPVDILGSLVLFHVLAIFKEWVMLRLGFVVGSGAQQIQPGEILHMESYGALLFIAIWSIWLARRHLRGVWQQVCTGEGDLGDVLQYRLALLGMLLSAAYVIGWSVALGMSLPVALGTFVLMTLAYFVTVKLIAATGFAYLLPNRTHLKGQSFVVELIGSAFRSPRGLVAFKVLTSNAFFGTFRIPAWPAIAHHLRMFSLRDQPRWVTAAVFVAFPVGFLVAAGATIQLAYEDGGVLFLGGKANWVFDDIKRLLNSDLGPDLGKWTIWLSGWFEAAGIVLLRSHFSWFSLHPIGLAFQYTFGTRLYCFSLFLVWLVKVFLLRYGGVKAYRGGKPFFYGLAIGYVAGVTLSVGVDVIWFPLEGHRMHGW